MFAVREVLEVIANTQECADPFAVSYLMAMGFVVEREGKLYLTDAGARRRRQP